MTIDYSIVFQQFSFFYQKYTFVSLNKLDFMNHYILLKLLNMIYFFLCPYKYTSKSQENK
jgi:hypothetical protein